MAEPNKYQHKLHFSPLYRHLKIQQLEMTKNNEHACMEHWIVELIDN
jgi:hypothetical protein